MVGYWEDRINRLHKGIIVVKSKLEDRKIENEAPATGAKEEVEAKSKSITVRKIQAFMPQWAKPISKKRLAFETEID